MSRLAGQIVIISGASSGIGEQLARELVARGAVVGLLARRADRLAELAEELRGAGGTAAWAEADVADNAGFAAALDRLANELGGVDVIVANAGYGLAEPPHRFTPGASLAMYDVNVGGMLRMIDWALPRFLERRAGHIVGVASLASYLGMANSYTYCGTKAAMRMHLQGLRVTLARYGVAVTTICPGFVDSELTERNKTPMPFKWPTDRAGRVIADAIERRSAEVTFPWQLASIIGLVSRLPNAATEWLLRRMSPRPRAS